MSQHPPDFRCGYVAIIGWPNVGKSTLLNSLLDMKLSIVAPKPQTTRESILGILNQKKSQIIFLDTPGWLEAKDQLQTQLRKAINRSVHDDADVILWLLEPKGLNQNDKKLGEKLAKTDKPVVVVVNKTDAIKDDSILTTLRNQIEKLKMNLKVFGSVSAKTKEGLSYLKESIEPLLPKSLPYFPTDQVTDRWERYYVSELIREKIFSNFQEEVPHASAVVIDEFKERDNEKDYIKATVYVETEGQKKIMVGKKGTSIRNLSQSSRFEIEKRLGRQIYLEINIKVKKSWRKDPVFIKNLHQDYT